MGTTTTDEATEAHHTTEAAGERRDDEREVTEETTADAATDDTGTGDEGGDAPRGGPSGVGQGAGAIVSVALGVVSLTGGWTGTVAAARETLVGQLQTSSSASVATQIKEVYGDAWHTTALWAGLFALAALVTAVVVLVRSAFGTPGGVQAGWIRSAAWAGVSLGVTGLLLAVLKYSDALLGLPSAS